MSKLNEKQKAFADYYIESLNATESYKKAYGVENQSTAESNGSRLLRNAKVKNYIDEVMSAKNESRIASQDEILQILTDIARGVTEEEVNAEIEKLPNSLKLPFPMVKEALQYASKIADVAIVSSANLEAVLEEWERYGLMPYVDIVLSQNVGSKAYCIQELLKKGYNANDVVMCGDAPGDKQAAEKNGVFYFPIIVKKEKESWIEFINN